MFCRRGGACSARAKVWRDDFKEYFSGVDDPEFVVIELKPTELRYAARMENPPETVTF